MTAPTVSRREFASKVAVDLAAQVPTVVTVAGLGRGWYVTAVDWQRREFVVQRGAVVHSVAWHLVEG